ncbi:transposase [Achromobacter animicus]|uniref:transposase n=1 Tax=Achromobacter animicus TaxID=1389935 RepID=UPI001582A28B|nr:transposase [Achromobacter animicus]
MNNPTTLEDYSDEFKRQLVALTLKPLATVKSVAENHGVPRKLLLAWRREYKDIVKALPVSERKQYRDKDLLHIDAARDRIRAIRDAGRCINRYLGSDDK